MLFFFTQEYKYTGSVSIGLCTKDHFSEQASGVKENLSLKKNGILEK